MINISQHLYVIPQSQPYIDGIYYTQAGVLSSNPSPLFIESGGVCVPKVYIENGFNRCQFVDTGQSSIQYTFRSWENTKDSVQTNGAYGLANSFSGGVNILPTTKYYVSYNPLHNFYYVGCWLWQELVDSSLSKLSNSLLGNPFTGDVENPSEVEVESLFDDGPYPERER